VKSNGTPGTGRLNTDCCQAKAPDSGLMAFFPPFTWESKSDCSPFWLVSSKRICPVEPAGTAAPVTAGGDGAKFR
jgi:hypothetical protein